MRKAIMLACVGLLAACATQGAGDATQGSGDSSDGAAASGEKLTISQGVWAKFQEYKAQLGNGDQYFAASSTGGFSWEADKDKAVSECQQYSKGGTCVVFAHNDEILVPYEVAQ